MIKDYDIVGSYNNQRVKNIDAERSINLFEYIDPQGKKPKNLLPTSGILNQQINFSGTTGGFRAQFVFRDPGDGGELFQYCVIGSDVYKLDSNLSSTKINTSPLNTSSGYVGIDANTFQIIFVDGVDGYIYDTIAHTWTEITDTSFPGQPIDTCYLDGFFVVANGSTNQFQLSEYNQGLIWGEGLLTFTVVGPPTNNLTVVGNLANFRVGFPVEVYPNGSDVLPAPLAAATTYYVVAIGVNTIQLSTTVGGSAITYTNSGTTSTSFNLTNNGQLQLGQITSHPGTIVACRTLHRRLFLFSQNYTEVWDNQGIGSNLPFRRINSLLIEYGTPAIGSIAVSFDRMFFLSQDREGLGSIMEITGSDAIPVSSRALDFELAQYAADLTKGVADARGFLIKENGLIFYRLNFTQANHTYVYGVTTSNPQNGEFRWHEEETLQSNRHPAQTHAYFNGINYVGNYQSPILYLISADIVTNDGEPIKRIRIARPVVPEGYQRIRVDRFQIDLLQGNAEPILSIPNQYLLTENNLQILTEDDIPILAQTFSGFYNPTPPKVYLSISKDGGVTYGNRLVGPMGGIGQRTFRTVWRKLGVTPRGQAFVPKIEFYAEVPFVVLGAAWAFEVLPE